MRYKRTRVEKFSEVSRIVCDLCQQPEALGMKFREFQTEDGEDMPDDPHPRRDR